MAGRRFEDIAEAPRPRDSGRLEALGDFQPVIFRLFSFDGR
jgi:hypothetical protein